MATLHHVKSARASAAKRTCTRCGTEIKPGDSYYWFANRIGKSSHRKDYCSAHRPRPSEMTTSDKLSQLYGAQESVEDAQARTTGMKFAEYQDNLRSALEDAAQVARDVGDEYRESQSNLPESLQNSSVGEEIGEKADACDTWADALEQAASEVETYTYEPPDDLEDGEEADDEAPYNDVDAIANDAVGALEL